MWCCSSSSFAVASVLFLLVACGSFDLAAGRKRVMPWMCLERCGDNTTSIVAQLEALALHKDIISAVSFERFNLGPQGALVTNNFTEILPFLKREGFKTYPMISSYPYPPQFLEWMRYVFDNPQPFIDTCVSIAVKEDFTGYNVDWEPASGSPTSEDARRYANFLSAFSTAMHAVGKEITVDFAGWSPIWDYTELNASKADRLMCMGTYATKFDTFLAQFRKATDAISLEKLGIGLETVNPVENNRPLTDQEWEERFQVITAAGVQEIDLWKTPIPDNLWKFLFMFVQG